MTLDLEDLRRAYALEVPIYRQLAEEAARQVGPALRDAGLDAAVSHRAKEVPNFILKALRKHREKPEQYADPITTTRDKAGIRILVPALDEVEVAVSVVERVFALLEPFEDTAQRYQPSELGYLGRHGQATLRTDTIPLGEDHLRGREFEIQIHTRAQNAWSTVSHPLLYKPVGGDPAPDVARKVYRAVALVSLFDEQLKEARMAVMTDPSYRPASMLAQLQKLFVPWMVDETDDETSLWILTALVDLWPADTFVDAVQGFVHDNRDTLDVIYERYRGHFEEHPLLAQPEVLAIYERLSVAPAALAAAWVGADLPRELLESVKDVFGT